jgi:RNA polymerase sigma factor (sigma-70 family)
MNGIVRHLRRVALLQNGADLTDGQLLENYLRQRDETAFEALVRRHGPMVLGVCRRILHNAADAEDAFQATFLVLVRKGASIVPRSLVGNWLHGVARNTALKAKAMNSKRRGKEQQAAERIQPEQSGPSQQLQDTLDEELSRLPEKYRVPIILCELQGRTLKEVAVHLGWPQGTVAGRLARARVLLAKRLTQRGLALSAGALTAALAQGSATACVPPATVVSTVKAASAFAAGQAGPAGVIPAKVAALTEGVLKAMLLNKLMRVAGFAVLAVVVAVLVVLARPAPTNGQPKARILEAQRVPTRTGQKPQAATVWKERHAIKVEQGTQIFSASVSPDGKLVAVASTEGVKLVDAVQGKDLAFLDLDVAFTTAISGDGKTLATGHVKAIKLWDAATGKGLGTLADDARNISKVAFAPDGKLLATAEAGTLRLWDLAKSKELLRLESGKPEERVVYAVAFCPPDGKVLASAEGPAKTAILWDVSTGKKLRTFAGHTQHVLEVAFSPDGKTLATAGGDGEVKLWDVSTGKEQAVLKCQTGGRHSLAFSPDGKLLATAGGASNQVVIWEMKTGKEVATLDHTGHVRSVAFSRDGQTLVTAGDDAIRIWQAQPK